MNEEEIVDNGNPQQLRLVTKILFMVQPYMVLILVLQNKDLKADGSASHLIF